MGNSRLLCCISPDFKHLEFIPLLSVKYTVYKQDGLSKVEGVTGAGQGWALARQLDRQAPRLGKRAKSKIKLLVHEFILIIQMQSLLQVY